MNWLSSQYVAEVYALRWVHECCYISHSIIYACNGHVNSYALKLYEMYVKSAKRLSLFICNFTAQTNKHYIRMFYINTTYSKILLYWNVGKPCFGTTGNITTTLQKIGVN